MSVIARIATPLFIVLFSILSISAQPEDLVTHFSGKVVDQNSAAIANARITAVLVGTRVRSESATDADGGFMLDLARGRYTVSAEANGFESHSVDIDLTDPLHSNEIIVLSVRSATATVTVSDDAVYVAADTFFATKTYTPLRDVPQAITVIKRDQIVDQNLSSIADVVRYVPGITSHQGENNRDEVVIRGNRSNADFYRDSVRDDVQYYRDLYNTERIEALKGPNAMIFGRGGGGGVINRVTKEAGSVPIREFTITGGSYRNRRVTGDLDQPLGDRAAFRINGVYENSDSFRRFVGLERAGINPTVTFWPDEKTSVRIGYEFFRDRRTADRGMTSFQGKPVDLPISTYYGDPNNGYVRADVNNLTASVERLFGGLVFRDHFSYGYYDRGYQNYVPGAANATGTLVTLTAYNNATSRKNLFNQTDLTYSFNTGSVKHTIVGGTEFGKQITSNFRNTGYFNNLTTAIQVPFSDPVTQSPITFRQSGTDADNHLNLDLAAAFIQDQIELSKYFQAIIGVRYDYFGLTYHNNRNNDTLERVDNLASPRVGLVFKPVDQVSVYTSYAVSYLPSSGDQFASLTAITQQVKPEKFQNYEAGVKWDIGRGLSLTSAVYRLDRTNTRSTDPNDPTRIVQTGSQRTDGFELGLSGSLTRKWSISGGYAWQDARITSSTAAAPAGRQVAQVPRNTFSLWNKYQVTKHLGLGLGLVSRSDMFAAIDNTIVLPGYIKGDAAVFYNFNEKWRLQANIENITNVRYFVNADSNTNISPGGPRGAKVSLIARF
ncbi:TonB-dependent siderophore receptor [soil metagenome]